MDINENLYERRVYVEVEENNQEYSIKPAGLSSQRIEKFHTFKADQQTILHGCSICINGVVLSKLMMRLDCNHIYCFDCIKQWFMEKNNCPLCRECFDE